MGGEGRTVKPKLTTQGADSTTPKAAAPQIAGLSLAGQIAIRTVSERTVSEPGLAGLVWSVKWQ